MSLFNTTKSVFDIASSSSPIAAPLRQAIAVIEAALDEYGQDHISLSFNGGKDCTVLLHIYAAVLHKRQLSPAPVSTLTTERATQPVSSLPHSSDPSDLSSTESSRPAATAINGFPSEPFHPIKTIYIPMPSPFPQMESFIAESTQRYNLLLFTVPCAQGESGKVGMKHALELYKTKRPEVKAILIGIRRGDPFSETLTHTTPTDVGWPEYMRIHPILEWTYAQVWQFLQDLEVPYCELYDQGYTSLGSTFNTYPNPYLRITPSEDDPSGNEERYRPAYELVDGSQERCGRGSNSMAVVGGQLGTVLEAGDADPLETDKHRL